MRHLIFTVTAAALVLPAVSVSTPALAKSQYKEWVGKDGRRYCRRSNGTVGVIAGGVTGVLVGRAIDNNGDRTLGTLAGAAAGALAGRAVDREISKRKCNPR